MAGWGKKKMVCSLTNGLASKEESIFTLDLSVTATQTPSRRLSAATDDEN